METIQIYAGLTDAINILTAVRREHTKSPVPVWNFVANAIDHLGKEVSAMLAPEAEV